MTVGAFCVLLDYYWQEEFVLLALEPMPFGTVSYIRIFYGDTGNEMCLYLSYLRNVQHLSESTIRNKEQYLYEFFCYLEKHSLTLNNLSVEFMEDFFRSMDYSLASRHNCGSTLRIYFRYAYDNGINGKDNSVIIPIG